MKLCPPKDILESTTLWSFPSRGDWATHKGDYRGNWAPQIPRNIILKYSDRGDLILDPFIGSGTTAIEAKLLGRKCVGLDINPEAIKLAKERTNFPLSGSPEPELLTGNAKDTVKLLKGKKVDLICAHPPYSNIIRYSEKEGDLSHLPITEFLKELETIVDQFFEVLKEEGHCAILIGDTRKQRHIVPLGFWVMQKFIDRGFKLKEIVIKEQHNCKTTPRWTNQSKEQNFLLIAHEYLFIFRKPSHS